MLNNYFEEVNFAVTISDINNNILYMNDKSAKTFANNGGKNLIGKNLFDCHSQRSKDIMTRLINKSETNVYTIEKNGIKKMIYQTPWYEFGKCMGLVELSFEIPFEMSHFVR